MHTPRPLRRPEWIRGAKLRQTELNHGKLRNRKARYGCNRLRSLSFVVKNLGVPARERFRYWRWVRTVPSQNRYEIGLKSVWAVFGVGC